MSERSDQTAPQACEQPAPWLSRLCAFKDSQEALLFLMKNYPFLQKGLPKELAILGSSEIAASLVEPLRACNICISGVFDHNPEKTGTMLGPVAVRPFADLVGLGSEIPVIVATHRLGRAFDSLTSAGCKKLIPFSLLNLLEPDFFPPHPFYCGMIDDLIASRDNIARLYRRLHDEVSRATLDAVIGFRLTLDPSVFQRVLSPFPYCAPDILGFGADEVMLDGGAFNGDTTALFSELVGNRFRRILAVEPSDAPRLAMALKYRDDPRVIIVDACLYNQLTTISFDTSESRVSAIAATGTGCAAVTIDSLECADEITFIKLNIEGAESKALEGARNVILGRAPKLAVAAYHAPSDLWRIAEEIVALRNDYRLMLRQHDSGTIETVLYAVSKNIKV